MNAEPAYRRHSVEAENFAGIDAIVERGGRAGHRQGRVHPA